MTKQETVYSRTVIPEGEVRISFRKLANMLQSKPNFMTCWKWHAKGLVNHHTGKLVFLAGCREGGRLYTSWEAYQRFERELNCESH